MSKSPIAICTTSLIRNKYEEEIVFQTVETLNRLNIPVVITDGGSTKDQKEKIKSFPNIIFQETEGLTRQLVKSFEKGAHIADQLFYLQTDKLDFVKNHGKNIIKFSSNINKETMIIIERDTNSFESYPKYQQNIEKFLNFIISNYYDKTGDYYYGPKIIPSRLVSYLPQIKRDIKWGVEAYFYAIHKRLNLPISFYKVDIKAPKELLTNEDEHKKYRLEVVQWQIDSLLQGQRAII